MERKALLEVGGKSLIGYVIDRAKRIKGLSHLVLATINRTIDDPLCEYATSQAISIFRGDLNDVALRVLNCAKMFNADYFVRLNGAARS